MCTYSLSWIALKQKDTTSECAIGYQGGRDRRTICYMMINVSFPKFLARVLVFISSNKSFKMSSTQDIINSEPVVFFDMASCPFCRAAESALNEAGIAFKKVPIADHKATLKTMTGKTSAPSVWVKGTYVGGCNDGTEAWHGVKPMIKSGKFKEMLA